MVYLTQYDCITFYSLVKQFFKIEKNKIFYFYFFPFTRKVEHEMACFNFRLIQIYIFGKTLWKYTFKKDHLAIFVKIAAQRTAESALKSSSGWVTLDSAESLFLTSKDRVFSALEETTAKKSKPEKAHGIEENPKWNIISEILGEIRDEMKASWKFREHTKIIIMHL